MQDRFKFRYNYNNKIYDVFAIDFFHSTGQIVSLDRKETLMCKINLDNLIQCTGLKDKNGKLIYEGDIVKTSPSGFFDNDRDVFYIKFTDGYRLVYQDWQTLDTIGGFSNKLFEVIGNIYETPELLGEVSNDN